MATLADYYIQIIPSAEGIGNQLNNIMDAEAGNAGTTASNSFGSKFSAGMGNVAKVGAAAFGAFTATVGAGAATLASGISGVASYGDTIDKTSQKVGISAESFQKWDYVMNLAGTSMSECSMGMKTLTNKIDDAKNGSADALAMFEGLGISLDDLNSMSREDIWGATIQGMQQLEDSTERAALANDLFGKSGQNMTPLFNMTNEELNQAIDNTEKYNMVLSDESVKAAAAYQDSLTTMSGAFSGLKNSMMAEFLPGVTTVMDGLTEVFSGNGDKGIGLITEGINSFITNLTELVPQLSEVGGGILDALISALTENSDALLSAGSEVIISLADSIISNLPTLVTSLGDVGMQLLDAFLELAPDLVDAGLVIIENLATGIGESLPELLPKITECILTISATLIEHIDEIVSAGLTIFMGLVQGLIEATPLILEQLPTLLNSLITELLNSLDMITDAGVQLFMALAENAPAIIDGLVDAAMTMLDSIIEFWTGDGMEQMMMAGFKLFVALVENLPKIISTICAAVPKIISRLVSTFTSKNGEMKNSGTKLLTSVGEGITNTASKIVTKIKSIISSWSSAIKDKVNDWKNAGANLLTGLWNGISDKVAWLYNQITNLGGTILKKLQQALKEESPSKATEQMGIYLADGLGIGWTKEIAKVNEQIGKDLDYKGNIDIGTTFDDSALKKLDDVTTIAKGKISPVSNANTSLEGVRFTVEERIDLGDTELKRIVSDYTIRRIGADLRAVKVSRGGNNVL